MDEGGRIRRGRARCTTRRWRPGWRIPYFAAKPPKSLDRHSFNLDPVWHYNLEDGAATLAAFAAAAVEAALRASARNAARMDICAAAACTIPTLVDALRVRLGSGAFGRTRRGDARIRLEAQAFAYLAMRHLRGLAD